MTAAPQALADAVAAHQAGRTSDAERLYREILAADPQHVDALQLLGLLALQTKRPDLAVSLLKQAISLRDDQPAFHNNLGAAHTALGQHQDAESAYSQAVRLKPDYVDAHFNRATALRALNRLPDAAAAFRTVLNLKSDHADALNGLASVLKAQRRPDEALAHLRRAVEIRPTFATAWTNLANLLLESGRTDEAIEAYRRALAARPQYPEALNNLGAALHARGQFNAARDCFRQALALNPDYADAHYNLGALQQAQNNLTEAAASYRAALNAAPGHVGALANLAAVFLALGQFDDAVDTYRRTLAARPRAAGIASALAHLLQEACEWTDELRRLESLVAQAVDADDQDPATNPVSPFNFLAMSRLTSPEQQARCARQYSSRKFRSVALNGAVAQLPPAARPPALPPRKLILGYLSNDFRAHAVASLVAELFEQHDRERFVVCGLSYGPDDGSPMRHRIISGCDRFVDLRELTNAQAAEKIRAEQVDILIDLQGHTKGARTEILALRPAPIQVNYLGYPGTMGCDFIDYILVDPFIAPPSHDSCYSERLLRLPTCYQVNDGRREAATHTPSKHDCGLPDDAFVFCCFNNSFKITSEMFDIWMRLLRDLPQSVLWLLTGHARAIDNLRREATAHGVAPERLVFAPRAPLADHLARHRLADLFLDTLPYNAHTTASDALWCGVPLVTLAGEPFASRVAGSLLHSLGLDELITRSPAEYEAKTRELATSPSKLADVRSRLHAAKQAAPVFSARAFAREVEATYERIARPPAARPGPISNGSS